MAEEGPPGDNLFVTNLPHTVIEDDVKAIFPNVIQCKILPSLTPGQGTCVALVRLSSVEEAMHVRANFDGAMIQGYDKPLKVRFAGKPPKGAGKGIPAATPYAPYGGAAGATAGNPPSDNLYVRGLPDGADSDWVTMAFAQHGANVIQCKILHPPYPGAPTHALVRCQSVEEAIKIKEKLTGGTIAGSNEPCHIAYKRSDGGAGGGAWGAGDAVQQHLVPGGMNPAGGMIMQGGGCIPTAGVAFAAGINGFLTSGSGNWAGVNLQGGANGNVGGAAEGLVQSALAARRLPGHDLGNEENALCISNLPPDTQDVHLYKLCAPFGAICPNGAQTMRTLDGSCCNGIGYVNYVEAASMAAAILALDGLPQPMGNPLQCKLKGM